MSEEILICEHCIAKNALRDEILLRGSPIDRCAVCKSLGGKALAASDHRVKKIFRALIRFNLSEFDYNEHMGGDCLGNLVFQNRQIINKDLRMSELDFEDAFMVMTDDWYPKDDGDISLGGGYWNGCLLYGLRDRRDPAVEKIVAECFTKNYFDVLPQAKALIEEINADINSEINLGGEYFRARVGAKASYSPVDFFRDKCSRYYAPYVGSEIDRPPVSKATEGRLNRHRVSVLYLASNVETAISELRPHPGHIVSTAKFRLKRKISVANLAQHDIRDFLGDERLEVLRTILSISDVLNLPVQPDQKELYAVTQMFGDAVRELGFDAVSFRSSLGNGINLTCFAGDAFEIVPESDEIHEIASLSYSIIAAEKLPKDYDPDDFIQSKGDPLSNVIHSMTKPVIKN